MVIDNSGKGLASLGRAEDKFLAHVAPGERVVPPVISSDTQARLSKEMVAAGLDPDKYIVGPHMSINPVSGQPEFGWLKKTAKSLKKAVKKIAPIAAVIPGPWQPFAVVYNKGNALNNIVKGEGTFFDVLTLGAGGSQKVFGDKGALANIKAGTGITSLSNVSEALKANVGSFMDAPKEYLANISEQVAADQKAGYGGIFQNVGADSYGGQFIDSASSLANPLSGTGIMNAVGGTGMEGQMMPASRGQDDATSWLQQNFDPNDSITENGVQYFRSLKDGQYYTPDQAYQMYTQSSGGILNVADSKTSSKKGTSGQSVIGLIEDMIKGKTSNIPDHFIGVPGKSNFLNLLDKFTPEFKLREGEQGSPLLPDFVKKPFQTTESNVASGRGPTIDPKLLALALGYGKITRDAAIRQSGGMEDIRKSLRPDLAQQAVYNPGGGFDVGITANSFSNRGNAPFMPSAPVGTPMPEKFIRGAANGGIIQAYAHGGQVLDMRFGGESEGPGTGTSDDIPAMLSDGEFVMTAKATRGAGAFDVAEQDGGIMLLPTGEASREKGTDNMTTLMETFARYG